MVTIGFYSSSTPITALSPKRFARAKAYLAGRKVQLIAGKLTGQQAGYRSGTIQARADELNDLIHRPEVDVIMATIGGTNTNSVLPYLDYAFLRQHPKTFVGYSDATALLLAVKAKAPQCRVLYGPALVASFGEWPPFVSETWDSFQKVLMTSKTGQVTLTAPKFWSDEQANWEVFEHPQKQRCNHWHATGQSVLQGRLIGGNLNTIYGILASEYFPKLTKNDLLLIEDAATVEKNFAMLKDAGIFDQVKGIILGKHALFDDKGSHLSPLELLQEVLDNPQMPIIYDYDSCHTVPMMTTPIGAKATIDAIHMTATFTNF